MALSRRKSHAPDGGYDFTEKRLYRAALWNYFAEKRTEVSRDSTAMLLTGIDGGEATSSRPTWPNRGGYRSQP